MYLHESRSVVSDSLRLHGVHSIQSIEFSRPEYWSGEPFVSPGDLPKPGEQTRSPTFQAASLPAVYIFTHIHTNI